MIVIIFSYYSLFISRMVLYFGHLIQMILNGFSLKKKMTVFHHMDNKIGIFGVFFFLKHIFGVY